MKNVSRLLVISLIVCALCPAANAVRFFGTAATDEVGGIYVIDTVAQTSVLVFDPTDLEWYGATDSQITNCFYATAAGGTLYVINVVAHTMTPVGPYVTAGINGLAYSDVSGVLYGTDYASLYTIDKNTGLATLVGSFNGPTTMWGLDYDSAQNKMFGADFNTATLYDVDMATGNATPIGATGVSRITDLWYDSGDGTMYAAANFDHQILSVNTATGTATPLFGIQNNILGLAKPSCLNPVEDSSWGRIKSLFR